MRLLFYRKIRIVIGTTILLLGVFLLWNENVKAQQSAGPSISVAPNTFDLSAQAGDEINQKIKIYNRSAAAIPLKVRAAGFDAEEETGEMIEGEIEDSIAGWFKFGRQSFVVDPGKTESIDFTVKISEDARQQGYYAVIFLEADISPYFYNESQLQVIPGLGIPFMLKVGDEQTAEPLTILEYSISDGSRLEKAEKVLNFLTGPFIGEQNKVAVVRSGEPSFVVKLKNNSPYHVKLSGKIKLSGLGWKLRNELEFPPMTILPGKTRKVLVSNLEKGKMSFGIRPARASEDEPTLAKDGEEVDAKVGFGIMKAKLDLETERGIKKEESRWIIVFSWWMVFLVLATIVAVAAGAAFLRKKRFKKTNEIYDTSLKEGKSSRKL